MPVQLSSVVQTSGSLTSVIEESLLDAKYLHKLLNFQNTM